MKKIVLSVMFILAMFLSGCQIGNIEEFMKQHDTTLSAKEVQYDMDNQLDQNFGLSGMCELSDYYNYGYSDLQKNWFVVKVQPDNGDSWYIYCMRLGSDDLFQTLKDGSIYANFICIIKPDYYEKGQGNMAFATYTQIGK